MGSLKSGYEVADLLTLMSSAIRNDLHVSSYVKSVLDAFLSGSTDYESLRPYVWGQANPKHRRSYCDEERESREDRKRERRSKRCHAQRFSKD